MNARVLWNTSAAGLHDETPPLDSSLPIFSYAQAALAAFSSCLTAVRFADFIEVHPDAEYDALAVENHRAAR